MSHRRTPPKRRGPAVQPATERTEQPCNDAAPGHLGGSFDHAGYDDQRWDGYFGFRPVPDMPIDKRREARA